MTCQGHCQLRGPWAETSPGLELDTKHVNLYHVVILGNHCATYLPLGWCVITIYFVSRLRPKVVECRRSANGTTTCDASWLRQLWNLCNSDRGSDYNAIEIRTPRPLLSLNCEDGKLTILARGSGIFATKGDPSQVTLQKAARLP